LSEQVTNNGASQAALEARSALNRKFLKRGLMFAVTSGMCYAMYTTFMMLAQSRGAWADWYGPNTAAISLFAITYILGALGSGINDTCSGVWGLSMNIAKGRTGDVWRCIKSKPTLIIILSAIIGGPMASSMYIISLQLAGSMIIPITTTYPAIGAIIARIFLKQPLTPRMGFGILLCLTASIMIGSTGMGDDAAAGALQGCVIALIAAFCWAIEGVVVGYTTTIMDYEIAITIRQFASGVTNLLLLTPFLCLLDGEPGLYAFILSGAVFTWSSMKFFIICSFFALFAFSLWYKGNNMCGAALGMAANSAYCFWGPLFCWVIVGIIFGEPGWELPLLVWAAAIIMFIGIVFIATNPFTLFSKGGQENATS